MFAPGPTVMFATPPVLLTSVVFGLTEIPATCSLGGTFSFTVRFVPGCTVLVKLQPAVALLVPAVAVSVVVPIVKLNCELWIAGLELNLQTFTVAEAGEFVK